MSAAAGVHVAQDGGIPILAAAKALERLLLRDRLSPVTLLDSAQVRLKRMHPGAHYRATTSTVQVPIPRAGGIGAQRIRDVELVQLVANLVTALQGKPQQDIGITSSSPAAMSSEERQAR